MVEIAVLEFLILRHPWHFPKPVANQAALPSDRAGHGWSVTAGIKTWRRRYWSYMQLAVSRSVGSLFLNLEKKLVADTLRRNQNHLSVLYPCRALTSWFFFVAGLALEPIPNEFRNCNSWSQGTTSMEIHLSQIFCILQKPRCLQGSNTTARVVSRMQILLQSSLDPKAARRQHTCPDFMGYWGANS